MWCPMVPVAHPALDAELWMWRGFGGAAEEAPCWGWWFQSVTQPTGPPAPGPGSHTPDVLCRAELKAEPKRGSVLSSVWEHPPRGSGLGLSLPSKCLGFLSSSSDLSRGNHWAAQGQSVLAALPVLPFAAHPGPQTSNTGRANDL